MRATAVLRQIVTNRWFITCVCVIAAYTLAGFFLLPFLAQRYVEDYGKERLKHEIAVGTLRFNPFTLCVEAEKIGIESRDGSPLLILDYFSADFALLSSLRHRAWAFSDIRMTGPYVHLVVTEAVSRFRQDGFRRRPAC